MSSFDAIDIDGLKVGPSMVRGYIDRIAGLEAELDIANKESEEYLRELTELETLLAEDIRKEIEK